MFVLVVSMTSIAAISAEDYSVSGNFTNLNNEIRQSVAGEVINVDGNITLQDSESNSYKNGITINHDLEIDGNGYAIDAKSANGERNSVFTITNKAKVVLKDLVIMNAYRSSQGGAINVASGCTLTLINCTFLDNGAVNRGGAIYSMGALTITDCNFESNTIKQGTAYGGAIFAQSINLIITNTNFTNNYATNGDGGENSVKGGAISCEYCYTIQITDCNFINNTGNGTTKSTAVGGAVHISSANLVNFTNCNFTNNLVMSHTTDNKRGLSRGGALAFYSTRNCEYITNCRFIGNGADDAGGALRSTSKLIVNNSYFAKNYLIRADTDDRIEKGLNGTFGTAIANDLGGTLKIINTVIENHHALNNNSYGTVFYHDKANIYFENVTMRNNSAAYGGAIYNYNGDKSEFNIVNSTFINNNATHGGAIYNVGQVLKISNTDFINSSASCEGGVISSEQKEAVSSTAILELKDVRFINSTAKTDGGAVYANQGCPIFILDSYITNSSANAGGAIYSKSNKNIIINNTTFVHNNATTRGGAILASNESIINCSLSTFNDNKAEVGGAISAFSNSEVNLIDCAFNNNAATLHGGAIHANESSIVNVVNSNFKGNNATKFGGAIAASVNASVFMSNSVFENNVAQRGGAVYENENSTFIGVNSTFISNHATVYGGAIDGSVNVEIHIYDSKFNNNSVENDGGAIFANNESKIHIENTNFTNNSANGASENSTGGAISGSEKVNINILNSNFENNSADRGGAIRGDYNSVIVVTNSTFIKNNASFLGGAISGSFNVGFNITDSIFEKNTADKGGAISGNVNSTINVTKSKFTNNLASTDGGAIAGLVNVRVVVSDSAFDANTADNGGAISGDNFSIILASESEFKNNTASQNGGAISGAQVNIIDSILIKNEAKNGGAVYSSAESYIGYNNFNDNSAKVNGSAIYSSGGITIVKNTLNEEDVEGFSSIYLTNGIYNETANLTQNTIATNLLPIYNNGNLIVSPTKLVIIDNKTHVISVNQTQEIFARLYDDNNNTIGSSSNVNITVWDPETNFTAEFNNTSWDFSSTIPFKGVTNGVFPVTGFYNNAIDSDILSGVIIVGNIPTVIVIEIPNMKYNQTRKFNQTTIGEVHLFNEYGFAITGDINVTVVIDGNITINVPIYDNGLGYINLNLTDDLMVGNHSATVTFNGTSEFLNSTNKTTFNVTKLDTKATIDVPNIVSGDNITGTITLVDEYGQNVTGNVTVTIADWDPFDVKVINGMANFTLNKTLPAGINYNAHVAFNGTEIYNPCGESNVFMVIARDKTNITVTIDVPDIFVGDNVTGSVTLTDENGTGLNGTVTVKIGNSTILVNVTNGTGNFTLNETFSADDDYYAQVEFNGTEDYNPAIGSDSFNVNKIPTNVTIEVSDIFVGDNVTGNVTLRDINGTALSGNVSVKINNSTIIVEVINGTGNFNCNLPLSEGTYSATVEFNETYFYNSSRNSTLFNVIAYPTIVTNVTIDIPDIVVGENVTGSVTLRDKNGTGLTGKVTVTVPDFGSVVVNVTNGEGNFTLNELLPAGDNYYAQVQFMGNKTHLSSINKTSFNVRKIRTNVTISVPDVFAGETVTGNVTLTDENGTGLTDTVTVKIPGLGSYVVNVTNGAGNFTLGNLIAGNYYAQVDFGGNDTYGYSVGNTSFNVRKIPTNVTISIPSIIAGANVTGNVTLECDGVNLTGIVTVVVGASSFDVNVTNGKGTFNLNETLPVGDNYYGQVDFYGNTSYIASYGNTSFNVIGINTNVTIAVSNITVGENVIGNVTLKDEFGNGLNDTVIVTISDLPPFVVNVINGTGKFNESLKLPAGDDYYAQVEFIGNDVYGYSINKTAFNVVGINTTVTIAVSNITVGENVTGNITLKGADGKNITANVTVTIYGEHFVVAVVNGTGNFTQYLKLPAGDNYYAQVAFNGTEVYSQSIGNTSFNVNGTNALVAIVVSNITVGDNVTGFVTLKDANGTNITGNVTVVIDGNYSFVVLVENGTGYFNRNLTLPAHDDYYAQAEFILPGKYGYSVGNTSFNVRKIATNVTVEVSNITFGDNVTGSVTLKGADDTNLTGNVTVTVDGVHSFVVSVVNGTGNFTHNLPLSGGNYYVQADFNGTERYGSSIGNNSFNVYRKDTQLTIEVSNITVGENVTGFVTLKDSDGNNLSGNVNVTVDGVHSFVVSVVNGTGNFTHNLTLSEGNHYIQVDFKGNESYNPSENHTSFDVVNKTKTDTILTVEVPDVAEGENVTGSVTLKDSDGNNLTGNVTVKIGNSTIIVEVINGTGKFTLNETLPKGNYHVQADYPGNETYGPCEDQTSFNVIGKSKTDTKVTIEIPDHAIFDKVNATITLTDYYGNPLTANVTVVIADKTQVVEVIGGMAHVPVDDTLEYGTYSAEVFYWGDERYNPSQDKDSFIVNKLNTPIYAEYIKDGNNVILIVKIPGYRNETIKLAIDNPNYKKEFVVEVINGIGTLIVEDLSNGDYIVNIIYDGNEIYWGNGTKIKFTISDGKSTPSDAYYGESKVQSSGSNNLETGNPIVLGLLALLVIPIRRILKR